jgi:hypothetical protein
MRRPPALAATRDASTFVAAAALVLGGVVMAGCGAAAPSTAPVTETSTETPPGLEAPAKASVAGWVTPTCEPGSMPVAGEAACVPMGADCNASGWPDPVEGAARTLYVKPGASGDGSSRESPFGTVAAALAAAREGDAIALAAGRHAPFRVTRAVRIVGACTAKTIVETPTENLSKPTVEYVRGGGSLENMTLTGPAPGMLMDTVTEPLLVRNVAIVRAARWGVGMIRGTTGVTLDHVHVVDLRTGTATGGRGFELSSGGTVTLRSVTVQGAHGFGAAVLGATSLEADRFAVLGVAALPSPGAGGQGISVTGRSRATVTRSVVRGARELGVVAAGSGVRLDLTDTSIEDIDGAIAGDKGYGLRLEQSAEATLRRVEVLRTRAAGIIGTTRARATLEDLTVRETRAQGDGDLGIGVAFIGARVEGTRVALEDSRGAGLFVAEASEASFAQLTVRRVLGRERDATLGMGALVGGGSTVAITGALVEDARTVGIAMAQAGTRVTLGDVLVRRVRSSDASGYAGGGVAIGRGTTLEGANVRVHDVQDYGVLVAGDDAHATLSELRVQGVGVASCARAGSACVSAGIGILQVGGRLDATAFDVRGCGIGLVLFDAKRANDPEWVANYGTIPPRLFMSGGRFTENGVGVNVQTDDLDPATAFVDVESFGNASGDFTSDAIALANPSASFEGIATGGL